MSLGSKQLDSLARLLHHTVPEELDCATILDLVAPYLEARQSGGTISADLAVVKQHLRVCPECHEEYLALAAALAQPG